MGVLYFGLGTLRNYFASVAQLVEHVPEEHGVSGSIPFRGTKLHLSIRMGPTGGYLVTSGERPAQVYAVE